jgi:osmoprotectant transport system permease protein
MKAGEASSGLTVLGVALIAAVLALPQVAGALLGTLGLAAEVFSADRLFALARTHSLIALSAVIPAAVAGVGLGILVTRPAGRSLRPLVDSLVAAAQSVPPVVVVALALPSLGFGAGPTVLALVMYCVMPVLRGTIASLDATPGDVIEAAQAMGMTPVQILCQVEIPLALPVVAGAVRVAFILAIATAAVGAVAGANTLGTPIIIGLQNQKEAYILQGAAATAALAFLADGLLLIALGALQRGRSLPAPRSDVAPVPE